MLYQLFFIVGEANVIQNYLEYARFTKSPYESDIKSSNGRCLSKSNFYVNFHLSFRCKKWEVPIEKVYNKTQRDKFRWAIDMADADYRF